MKKYNILKPFIVLLIVLSSSLKAQTDTCNPRPCNGFFNTDAYQNWVELYRIRTEGIPSVSSGTVSVRQEISQAGNSSQFDTISGHNLSDANLLYQLVSNTTNGATNHSLFKNPGSSNKSVFLDTTSNLSIAQLDASILAKVSGTLTVSTTGATAAVTYSYVTSSGTNTVVTGARLISICNTGSAVANFNGATLPAGACVTLPAVVGILHPQITYDCLTSALIVTVER